MAISHEDGDVLKRVEDALLNPYYQPYLGRRSCPLNHDFYLGCFDSNPIELLEEYPWQAKSWYQRRNSNRIQIISDSELFESSRTLLRRDRVQTFSQKERQHGFRAEAVKYIEIGQTENSTNHDVFEAIGDDNLSITSGN